MTNIKQTVQNNAPGILIGGAVLGSVLTMIFSFKAGMKVNKVISEKKSENENPSKEEKKEIAKEVILESAPSVFISLASLVGTIACGVASYKMSSKKIGELQNNLSNVAAVAGIATSQLKGITNEIKEEFGENKYKKIRDKALSNMEDEPEGEMHYILDTGGTVYCCIRMLGIEFISTYDKVRNAIENFSYKVDHEGMGNAMELLYTLNIFEGPEVSDLIFWTSSDLHWEVDNFDNKYPRLPIETTTIMLHDRPYLAIVFDDYHIKKF